MEIKDFLNIMHFIVTFEPNKYDLFRENILSNIENFDINQVGHFCK